MDFKKSLYSNPAELQRSSIPATICVMLFEFSISSCYALLQQTGFYPVRNIISNRVHKIKGELRRLISS